MAEERTFADDVLEASPYCQCPKGAGGMMEVRDHQGNVHVDCGKPLNILSTPKGK